MSSAEVAMLFAATGSGVAAPIVETMFAAAGAGFGNGHATLTVIVTDAVSATANVGFVHVTVVPVGVTPQIQPAGAGPRGALRLPARRAAGRGAVRAAFQAGVTLFFDPCSLGGSWPPSVPVGWATAVTPRSAV